MLLRLIKSNAFYYIIFFTILSFICTFLIVALFFVFFNFFNLTFPNSTQPFNNTNAITKFISVCFLAPLLETFFFQYLLIDGLKWKVSKNYLIVISACLFGLSHFYSIPYMIKTFIIGLVFGVCYLNWLKEKPNSFMVTASVHSLYNLIVFVVDF